MKKIVPFILILLLCSCSGGALAEGFSESALTEHAKEVITLAGERDYDAIYALVRDDYKKELTVDGIKEQWQKKLEKKGAPVEYKSFTFTGVRDSVNRDCAIVVAKCSFTGGSAEFTLTFDENYELVGLYLK